MACAGILLACTLVPTARGTEPAPDYTEAFRMLAGLGLKTTAEARLVAVPRIDTGPLDAVCRPLQQSLRQREATAWLLPGDGQVRTLARGGGTVAVSPEEQGGAWKFQDPKTEAAALAKFLSQTSTDADSPRDYQIRQHAGAYLLAAAEFHLAGLTAEAATITSRLFELAGGPERPTADALKWLALAQYADVANRFEHDGDWRAFELDIRQIAVRFGEGLPASIALLKIADAVKQRAQGATPPKLRDAGIDAENRALAAALASVREEAPTASYGWLLETMPPEEADDEAHDQTSQTEAAPSVADRIVARKLQAIPLLVGLLDDRWPVAVLTQGAEAADFELDRERLADREAAEALSEMRIPTTRGAIATDLLRQAVPGLMDGSAGGLAAVAQDFVKSVGDGAPHRVADAYLRSGEDGFMVLGVRWLLANPGHQAPEAIEKVLLDQLEQSDDFPNMQAIAAYQSARSAQAAAFTKEVEGRLQRLADANPDNKEAYQELLRELRERAQTFDPEELVGRVLRGEQSLQQAAASLRRQGKNPALEPMESALLERAAASNDPAERFRLITLRSYLPSWSTRFFTAYQAKRTSQPLAPAHAALWLKLLEDDRRPSAEAVQGLADSTPIRESAAYHVLWETDPGAVRTLQQIASVGPGATGPLLARATAAARGVPPAEWPPIPDPAAVSQARRDALVAELAGIDSPGAGPWFMALPADEQVAVIEAAPADGFARFADHALRVERTAGPLVKGLQTGGKIDGALLRELGTIAAKELAAGKPVFVGAVRAGAFQPVVLFGWSGDAALLPASDLPTPPPGEVQLRATGRGMMQFARGEPSDTVLEQWLAPGLFGGPALFCYFGNPDGTEPDSPNTE
jgi:hypothetical protein